MVNTVKALTAYYLTIDDSLLITGDLSVSSFVNLGDRLTVRANGYSGTIRSVPLVDTAESSLAFYKYKHMRATNADDMWLMGQNYWFNGGYSVGTPGLGMCLNISTIGSVIAPFKIITPLIYSNTMRANGANQITLEDNVTISGNLVVNGSSNYKPYWVAGKVSTAGAQLVSKGRYSFTSARVSAGLYTITPSSTNPFDGTTYIVNLSFQVEGANATGRIVNSSLSASSFQVMTCVNTILADCIFHFTVLT